MFNEETIHSAVQQAIWLRVSFDRHRCFGGSIGHGMKDDAELIGKGPVSPLEMIHAHQDNRLLNLSGPPRTLVL